MPDGQAAPVAQRLRIMWRAMRGTVLDRFPAPFTGLLSGLVAKPRTRLNTRLCPLQPSPEPADQLVERELAARDGENHLLHFLLDRLGGVLGRLQAIAASLQ